MAKLKMNPQLKTKKVLFLLGIVGLMFLIALLTISGLILAFDALIAIGMLTTFVRGLYNSSRIEKITILVLLILVISMVLGVVVWKIPFLMNAITIGIVFALSALVSVKCTYNAWRTVLEKRQKLFGFAVIVLLIVIAPIPVRCNTEITFGGSDGGFGADVAVFQPCYSIFSHTYWNLEDKPAWKVDLLRLNFYRVLMSDHLGDVIFLD